MIFKNFGFSMQTGAMPTAVPSQGLVPMYSFLDQDKQ